MLQPGAEHVKIMRVLVKEIRAQSLTMTSPVGISQACATLEQQGGSHESARKPVGTNSGF